MIEREQLNNLEFNAYKYLLCVHMHIIYIIHIYIYKLSFQAY